MEGNELINMEDLAEETDEWVDNQEERKPLVGLLVKKIVTKVMKEQTPGTEIDNANTNLC